MGHILIAEDEAKISSFLDRGLRADGHSTTIVSDGESAYQFARSDQFDLMILDLGLPVRDGLSVLKALRQEQVALPVIVLTARDSTADAVAGLESGADDYVRKPFSFDELLARVRTRLRAEASPPATSLCVGSLTLDLRTRRATVDDGVVELTAREFALAETLARHPDQVLSRQQLLSQVWGFDSIRAPTSSTSTSATSAGSWDGTASRPSAAWVTAWWSTAEPLLSTPRQSD